ncbi:MAG: hypothetical protein ABSE73_24260, partial [Planctomycetota bacterium]
AGVPPARGRLAESEGKGGRDARGTLCLVHLLTCTRGQLASYRPRLMRSRQGAVHPPHVGREGGYTLGGVDRLLLLDIANTTISAATTNTNNHRPRGIRLG